MSLELAERGFQRRPGGTHRVAGAARRMLGDGLRRRDRARDALGPLAEHDHGRGWRQRFERRQHVARDHRPSWRCRAGFSAPADCIAGALAGGEDDCGERSDVLISGSLVPCGILWLRPRGRVASRPNTCQHTDCWRKYDDATAQNLPAMADFLLIFVLDGTLVDSAAGFARRVLNEVLHEHGHGPLSPRDGSADGRRRGDAAGHPRVFAACGGGEAEARAALPHYALRSTRPMPPAIWSLLYPGVREILVELRRRGYRTAVCTNKLQGATLAKCCSGFGIDGLFDGVAGGDRFAVRKPDPPAI